MSFQKILVAVERPPLASDVFAQALELAQKQGSNLMVFHCINAKPTDREISPVPGIGTSLELHVTELPSFPQVWQERLQKEIEQVQPWLQQYQQQASVQGVPAEITHEVGEPGAQICELARAWQADLIIVGRRGRTGLEEILLGSVSNYVVHHAPCSVLVIQGILSPATNTSDSV